MTKSRKILGFIGLVLALFMGALDATIVNIALPNIMEDLHTGLTDTSWVATIYVLAMSVFIITVSKLADIYGRKLVMLIGVVIFGIFSFACMMADSLLLLIILLPERSIPITLLIPFPVEENLPTAHRIPVVVYPPDTNSPANEPPAPLTAPG